MSYIQSHEKKKKQKWSSEEDELLRNSVKIHGTKNWFIIACDLHGRNCKQCRERWINVLDPQLNTTNWESDEDLILLKNHILYGNTWAKIAQFLPGRSPNGVKNRYYLLERNRMALPSTIEMLESEHQNKIQKQNNQQTNDINVINSDQSYSEIDSIMPFEWPMSDD
ncbi:Myb-like DNA-binding domain containing protein [Tritrichomonas foetus]|uniref:Myb-like DNA-binding domain containing protein n=1 Tax=Tritrichomonas foetus TaxID=1144522 RepID=A0A1J4JTK4_9EUKA|nr:Myb-like DNA-binding domain containing protein [Tritrichomonas foetus]|eukprot:OHT00828.1 Myb-like DNA-binding domain containing protein [Tritrichomonas foetus]